MKRTSVLTLKYLNLGKREKVTEFMTKYTECVNLFIKRLWKEQKFSGTFVDYTTIKEVNEGGLLGAALAQSAAQQALQTVKSQRKKRRKTMPVFTGSSITLDSRFVEIQTGKNSSFDIWVKLKGFGRGNSLLLPCKKHKHFNGFLQDSWLLKKSVRFRLTDKKCLMLDVFFEKDTPEIKSVGTAVGLDSGYKKLLVSSNNTTYGKDIESYIVKISNKKQGSLAFKRALKERNEYINREIKTISWNCLNTVVVEDLKNVKKNSRGKFSKQFNNKLQRWVYSYTLGQLEGCAERNGVRLVRVPPAYTSQRCSRCGDTRKENRHGEMFLCMACGHAEDADFNASKNILSLFSSQEQYSDPVERRCSTSCSLPATLD